MVIDSGPFAPSRIPWRCFGGDVAGVASFPLQARHLARTCCTLSYLGSSSNCGAAVTVRTAGRSSTNDLYYYTLHFYGEPGNLLGIGSVTATNGNRGLAVSLSSSPCYPN